MSPGFVYDNSTDISLLSYHLIQLWQSWSLGTNPTVEGRTCQTAPDSGAHPELDFPFDSTDFLPPYLPSLFSSTAPAHLPGDGTVLNGLGPSASISH